MRNGNEFFGAGRTETVPVEAAEGIQADAKGLPRRQNIVQPHCSFFSFRLTVRGVSRRSCAGCFPQRTAKGSPSVTYSWYYIGPLFCVPLLQLIGGFV